MTQGLARHHDDDGSCWSMHLAGLAWWMTCGTRPYRQQPIVPKDSPPPGTREPARVERGRLAWAIGGPAC